MKRDKRGGRRSEEGIVRREERGWREKGGVRWEEETRGNAKRGEEG